MPGLSSWNTITLVNTLASGEMGYFKDDLNQDTVINLQDFAKVANEWLSCTDPFEEDCVNVKF